MPFLLCRCCPIAFLNPLLWLEGAESSWGSWRILGGRVCAGLGVFIGKSVVQSAPASDQATALFLPDHRHTEAAFRADPPRGIDGCRARICACVSFPHLSVGPPPTRPRPGETSSISSLHHPSSHGAEHRLPFNAELGERAGRCRHQRGRRGNPADQNVVELQPKKCLQRQ